MKRTFERAERRSLVTFVPLLTLFQEDPNPAVRFSLVASKTKTDEKVKTATFKTGRKV